MLFGVGSLFLFAASVLLTAGAVHIISFPLMLLALCCTIPVILFGQSARRKCVDDPELKGKKLGAVGSIIGTILLGIVVLLTILSIVGGLS